MKKLILPLLCLISGISFAQSDTILYENFNVEPTYIVPLSYEYVPDDGEADPWNWISWDSDGIEDNNGVTSSWYWSESSVALADSVQGGVFMSTSWMENYSYGNRNWLITPGIYLSDDSGELTWKSAPYQTPLWADGYSVYISTTDRADSSFTEMIAQYGQYLGTNSDTGATGDYSLYDFSEGIVHGADGEYIEVDSTDLRRNSGILRPNAVSLSAYAGQTVYIAFVHDSDDDNILFIDDIMVTGNGYLDSDEGQGCTDQDACNYSSEVYSDDGSCSYPEDGFDCNGYSIDYDGIMITSIQEIQGDGDYSPYENQTISTKGVVTAVISDDFYIQDGEGTRSGIFVYSSPVIPSIGDSVIVTGVVSEFQWEDPTPEKMTEFAFPDQVLIINSNNPIPNPIEISTGDLANEDYESMLVQVNNVNVTSAPSLQEYNHWRVNDGTGECKIHNNSSYSYPAEEGEYISSIIGVSSYLYGNWKIELRMEQDIQIENDFENVENFSFDTLFYYDCSNTLIMSDEDYESFEIMMEDFDEGVAAPYDGETDADVLEYVSSFFWQFTTDQPNGVATFDYDENPDPSVPDSAWYFTAYSWFTNPTLTADNWLGMGPVTIPDEGAALKFHYRGAVSQWKDGFDLYITEGGMEPYNDIDPGYTDIAYSIEDEYPCAGSDTIWAEHTVSLNDFAGKSIYFTFHHTATDKEKIMLDNFLIIRGENIEGCTDVNASNFNPLATEDDGTCIIFGCMDLSAINYNPMANIDDETCIIYGCIDESACNFEISATYNNGTCIYPGEYEFLEYVNTHFSQGTDLLGNFGNVLSFNEPEYSYNEDLDYLFEIDPTYYITYLGDSFEIDSAYYMEAQTLMEGDNWYSENYELTIEYNTNYVGPSIFLQGTNLFTQGTNLFYNGIESLFETIVDHIYSIFWDYETEGVFDCEGCVNDMNNNDICDEFEIACPYPEFIEYNPDAPLYDFESCETFIIYGCMDSLGYNYNPDATLDDGSCLGCTDESAYNYSPLINIENNDYCEYLGCTNPISENYNSQANIDDGTCIIYGCTFEMFPNYNPEATVEDGSCSMGSTEIYGCLDPEALNYNFQATIDNGGCEYPVGCPLPDNWEYETSGINHTMMIPEGISIDVNGQPLINGSSIGVFYTNDNGELQCAGYTQINGEQTFIAIMGDDSTTDEIDGFQEGESFTWMVWDILTCQEYQLNASYSNGSSTYTTNAFTFLESLEHFACQQIQLPGGWFIYSSYIESSDMNAEVIMSSIYDNLVIVKNNMGEAYLPEWNFNGIGDLNFKEGYQIKTNTADNLEICGLQMHPEDHPIALQAGWNLISYLRETPAPVDIVVEDLTSNDNLFVVKDYNGSPYFPEWDFNGIGDMKTGQGYQIMVNNADTLYYLSNNEEYRVSNTQVIENKVDHFAKVMPTGNNMQVVIPESAWSLNPEIGSEIAAYTSSGILVGSAKYSQPITVLTLWGDDKMTKTIDGLLSDEPVVFKVWDKEQISDYKIENWSAGSNAYQIDAINVVASIEIDDVMSATNLFDAIPNPSQTKTNISFFIAETQKVNISVYNVVGELVEVLANSVYNPGTHQLEMQVSNIEAGSYFYTMRAGEFEKTKQLIILK